MARPRRLRHKLMLGLAVMVGSVGLLLGGTLYGINSYLSSVRTTERKLEELQVCTIVIRLLEEAELATPRDVSSEFNSFNAKIKEAEAFVPWYRKLNADTVARGLDPDDGKQETGLLDDLDASFRQLDLALQAARNTRASTEASQPLRNDPGVKTAYDKTRLVADNLRFAIIDDIDNSSKRSIKVIRQSLWIVGFAVAASIIMVLALLYYFRLWVFAPIKALQAGVQRVHRGDFNHPCVLTSGDELQELATEFNAMVTRVGAIHADLARQVNERSRQLVRSERMVSVGFLAAGVAHEINNPLASIAFCAEALERRLQDVLAGAMRQAAPADPNEAEVLIKYLKMIQQEAFRCKEITTKLLDFSRSGERKREPTDLGELIRNVLEIARHLPNCRGKGISFEPDGYVVASVNAQDLKSVILNLVVNALDSLDDDGSLTIRLSARDGAAIMTFTDTGCGMSADVLENIFEPFFTRSRTGKGTGLGLFISHQIIDQHGGAMQAASRGPGQGSTFTVRVPLECVQETTDAGVEQTPAILPFSGSRVAAA